MKTYLKNALALAAIAAATQAMAQVTFFEQNGFRGRSFTTESQVNNFERYGFNDRASSVVVARESWEVCENVQFGGRCVVLQPGQYPSLAAMGLNDRVSSVRAARNMAPAPAAPQVTFYENEGFTGRSFTTDRQVNNFARNQFNDRASSVVVAGGPWELCENNRFRGRCVVLRPGQYPSMKAMGLNDRVSSVRAVSRDARNDSDRYDPQPIASPDYRRRSNERLYEANVTSVRAVVGTPEQRCWVEPGQVAQTRGSANIPGAIAGALLGGILGHQVGGGTGKDLATAGGAIAGAALGANVGRNGQAATQDVQRCENVVNQPRAQYWDVSYNFRGQEHRTQMTTPPGPTVTVNEQGEPRN
ncbi:beta/gamma crystallin-related protein [Rhodoferax sp.]|uniref:beta/gamma crystallin-related protein n=1 Tax=Rhodoferax sp. TaxID=50421 RepID=UPI00262D4DF7|nr:beta/gamma crystallin-related protein [Rhodoferax sp.]MDD2917780.1 beta/gamma crystallin-related protein [Rhodoferax sp.]